MGGRLDVDDASEDMQRAQAQDGREVWRCVLELVGLLKVRHLDRVDVQAEVRLDQLAERRDNLSCRFGLRVQVLGLMCRLLCRV